MRNLTENFFRITVFAVLLLATKVYAQDESIYLDTNRGNAGWISTLTMNSNRVESIIRNTGTFGEVGNPNFSGAWPVGTGHSHVHFMTILVSANVIGTDGQEHHIASESYMENQDVGPRGVPYWWYPLPNYLNLERRHENENGQIETNREIANSDDPATYPSTWPGKDQSWDGRWNGYFGKDQFTADQEAMYVIDDSYNSEYPYYPVAADSARRGLGLQVESRLFQWAHPLAQDEIFIHFQVSNLSDNVYDRNIFFGAFADTHPGGLGADDDNSGFDQSENFVFAWDANNVGEWTRYTEIEPGYLGWKYLESPGFPEDGIDNDNDGLTDEKRDNDAGQWVFGFVDKDEPEQWHWSGDEDGDWIKEIDDVGSDGLGPFDLRYSSPDADGTEGNGRPDQGEPNFGKTDKDESDQIGLTSFYSPAYGTLNARDDEQIWNYIQPGRFETPAQNQNNLWVFASGPFVLGKRKTERFSVCWVFGTDRTAIMRSAQTAQKIYNNSYRFTKPPLSPTITAVPGDKRVTLYWDDIAETKSLDPIYGLDFEGYKIYRGTNSQVLESQMISDAFGNQVYKKPIAQFDLNDGIKGVHPIALGSELGEQYSSGAHYFMGEDTGLRHYFVDTTDVENGVTYYYAVVAYDKGYYPGMDDRGLGSMSPSESYMSMVEDGEDIIRKTGITRVVPNTKAINYVPGKIENSLFKHTEGSATGSVSATVVDPDVLPNGHVFELSFDTKSGVEEGIGIPYAVTYSIRDTSASKVEVRNAVIPYQYTVIDTELHFKNYEWRKYDSVWTSRVVSGFVLNFRNSAPSLPAIRKASGWVPGSKTTCDVEIMPGNADDPNFVYPVNLNITYSDKIIGKSFTSKQGTATFDTYFNITDANTGESIPFYLKESLFDKNGKWNKNEMIYIGVLNSSGTYTFPWSLNLLAASGAVEPQPGDTYKFISPLPFTNKDKFYFTTTASTIIQKEKSDLDKIRVVPNPYILAAQWERQLSSNGRGDRRINFIHLPSECTIRIFTQNGILLKTIQHSGNIADGSEVWDLTTEENLEVAFGVYIFHIDAQGIGEKVGTFAIIN